METFTRYLEHRPLYCHYRRFHEHFHVEIQTRVPRPYRRGRLSRRRSHWNHPNRQGIWLAKDSFGDVRCAHHQLGSVRKKDGRRKRSRSCSFLFRDVLQVGIHFTKAPLCLTPFFLLITSYGLAFSFGTTLLLNGEINVGIIVNVFLSIMIGSFSLVMVAPEMQAIANARGAAAKLFTTIDRTPPIDSGDPSGLKPEKVTGEITLHNVKFNYPARPDVPILKDLSISFAAGKTSALVGASGSGKSTIVSLVERFYDPLEGQVRLDGVDLKDLNLKWLRSQIGLVSQEPILFATTIRGNVEHGLIGTNLEHASDEERFAAVEEACTKANASGFINKLPLGYDTMVGERGFLLSGGQKQRIAIARAIVSDPPILLLDEATSALDTQSEGIVQNALDKAAAGRTTITIAHRCVYFFGHIDRICD